MNAWEMLKEMLKKEGYQPGYVKKAEQGPTPAKSGGGYRKRGIGWTRASHEEPKKKRRMRVASQRQLRAWRRNRG